MHPKKCDWFKDEVEYLGYVINKDGIRQQAKKLEKMLAIKAPKNASEVTSFVGMVNYYCYMRRQHSTLIAQLTEMSNKKGKAFIWNPRRQEAFEKLRKLFRKKQCWCTRILIYLSRFIPIQVIISWAV